MIHPRHRAVADDIWSAELAPVLTRLEETRPDDAPTRCRFVQGASPAGLYWSLPQNTERDAKAECPRISGSEWRAGMTCRCIRLSWR